MLAAANGGTAAAARAGRGPGEAPAGPAAMLAKAMDESRSMPTATSFRTLAVDTLDAKRKALNSALNERGMKVSFTHLIAWAIVQAAKDCPVMVPQLRGARRQAVRDRRGPVNLGIAVDVERKDGSRSLMVPASRAPTASTSRPSTPTTRT